MSHRISRRAFLGYGAAAALSCWPSAHAVTPKGAASTRRTPSKPYRIYAITFRGQTDVEKGFEDYFSSRKIPVQITYRDLNRDASRIPGLLQEIRATRPDLIYAWGTTVTLGVVGPFDAHDPSQFITDIP
jgi:putative ABC transport system substrate-binding protein